MNAVAALQDAFQPHVFIGALIALVVILAALLGEFPMETALILAALILVGIMTDVVAHDYEH